MSTNHKEKSKLEVFKQTENKSENRNYLSITLIQYFEADYVKSASNPENSSMLIL